MGNFVRTLSDRACVVASDTTWMEDAALAQLITTSQLEGMRRVAGMPDLHPGRGYPVGAAFFSVGHFYPALVGNDIGCGMALWQTDLKAASMSLDKLDRRVGNIDGPMDDEALRMQVMAAHGVMPGVHDASLGTIGGGNHFAEFQRVDTVFDVDALSALGVDAKRLLLLVHTGSRGLGERVLRGHVDAFGHRGLEDGTPEAEAYLAQHGAALRFVLCNRELVARRLLANVKAEGTQVLDVHHNFVAPASVHGQEGWLHRKGATPSDQGPVLIPGSRGDHSYLVQPLATSDDTLRSLAHGAGRKWVRSACKDRLLVALIARTRPVLTYKTRGECCE